MFKPISAYFGHQLVSYEIFFKNHFQMISIGAFDAFT